MQQAIWQHKMQGDAVTPEQTAAANNSRLLAQLLVGRGIKTPEAMAKFLNMDAYEPTSGLELPDAQVGLERIIQAIDEQQNILVYGDFDVDGQTGTSILYKALKHVGAQVSFYIPDRATEGHGLNATAVCKLVSARQIKLVITTDTGITDFNEVSLLNGLGVDTIVTDHHDLPENLPPALANINPKCMDNPDHPMYSMCGAGVAYKLCEQLLAHYEKSEIADELLAIAAVGTVVDMMPLTRENRWIVWAGLEVLNRRELLGVEALLKVANFDEPNQLKQIKSETIGFVIGPRLNALGRLERADDGVHLLLADTMDEATRIAQHLDALNRKRQEMCEATVLEAEQFLARTGGLNNEKAIVLGSPQWHPGIIGLVATRLKDRYNVPVFLMISDEAKGEVRCSARSIAGFHLHDELKKLSEYFLHFGGHAGAGGFALMQDKLPAFKKELLALARQMITDDMCRPTVEIDAQVQWHQLTPGLIGVLKALEPTGQGNPSPVLETEPLRIAAHRWMGERKDHLKMVLEPKDGKPLPEPLDAICWRAKERYAPENGDVARFVFSPSINTFQGRDSFQLMVNDFAVEGMVNRQPKREAVKAPVEQPALSRSGSFSDAEKSTSLQGHEATGVMFVDHRQRSDVTAMASQLLTQPNTRLFFEGTEDLNIPFFNPQDALTRVNLVSARELVFWGMPPSEYLLKKVLHRVQPDTIHWFPIISGITDVQAPRDALAFMYRWVKQTLSDDVGCLLSIEQGAAALGVTNMLMMAGLLVLQKIGVLSLGDYDAQTQVVQAQWQEVALGGNKHDVMALPEMGMFAQALAEQQMFVECWRTLPVDDWQRWLKQHYNNPSELKTDRFDMEKITAAEGDCPRREEVVGVS